MADTLKLEIVTPEAVVYSADVTMVTLPGEMIVRRDGLIEYLAVGEGLVEVAGDHVSILTDMAVAAEDIDQAKAEEARLRAEARLREKISAEEVAATNAALARSLAQLRVKRRRRV